MALPTSSGRSSASLRTPALEVAFEALTWSVAVLDEQGTVVAVNEAWRRSARRHGRAVDADGIGASYLSVCEAVLGAGTDDAEAIGDAIADLASGSSTEYVFEYPCHGPEGEGWYLARLRAGASDGARFVVALHQNVTDRRKLEEARRLASSRELEALVDARTRELNRANVQRRETERELRNSEQRFRAAANATADVIVEANLQTDGLTWFGDVDSQLGYAPGEFPRTSPGFVEHFHPDDRNRVVEAVSSAFARGETFHCEYRVRCRDGSYRHWESQGRVVSIEEGKPRLAIGAHRDITDRKRAEARLRASEQRFRMVADSITDLIVETRPDADRQEWYGDVDGLLGYEPGEFPRTVSGWLSAIHPDDVRAVSEALAASETTGRFAASYRIRCKNGAYRDWEGRGRILDAGGSLRTTIGAVTDVTEREVMSRSRRQAQRNLRDLTTRLFTAQEDERRRLAREFHDGFGQQIAAASIQLGSLRHHHPELAGEIRDKLAAIQDQIVELANDLRRVSHELHPAALEQLGLETALKTHCATVATHADIDIEFAADETLAARLPQEIATCVFRVAQTALHNVVRHSSARRASVSLRRNDTGIELVIRDDGVGFDVTEAKRKAGLGLVSMEERVRPLGGELRFSSGPDRGTEVHAVVPVPAED